MDIKAVVRMYGKPRHRRKVRPVRPSRGPEASYRESLLEITKAIRQAGDRHLLPVLKRSEAEYARPSVKDSLTTDGFGYDILAAFDAMATSLGGIDRLSMRLAMEAIERQRQETDRQLSLNLHRGLGVDLTSAIRALNVGPQIEAAVVANASLIKSLPSQAIEKLRGRVLNDVARGTRYETLAKDIADQFDITDRRAKLIARDQMSKVNAAITEAKQKALGIAKYEWVTSGDERVRESHADNNGKVFEWDNPPDTGHPGDDVNCRCIAVPVIEIEE
jgi:SPP1 gp7 family putative phage head morphogenesis protein